MTLVACSCGAKYKVPEEKLGKTAKCAKCGHALLLRRPDEAVEPIPLASSGGLLDDEIASAAQRSIEAPRGMKDSHEAKFDARPEDFGYAPVAGSRGVAGRRRTGNFFNDVVWTLLFFTNPHNLAVMIGVWIIMGLLRFALFGGFLAILAFIVVKGWYAAFKFSIIAAAANGEDDLPRMGDGFDDFWDGVLLPLFRYIAASLLAMLPIFIYLVWVFSRFETADGLMLKDYFIGAWRYDDYGPFLDSTEALVVGGLACMLAGMFMWPMFMLVAGLGGVAALVRLDLMFTTIVRTFPIYLLVVVLVFGSFALGGLAAALLSATGKAPLLLMGALVGMMDVYLTIVAMRVIGLYYHHYKKRFAWSWG
ncbi:MAG: hypothetical protein IT449_02550 [Phycisphaerales bacterium]|nr:hypothetical protein [Phycisphaerales bacterium]